MLSKPINPALVSAYSTGLKVKTLGENETTFNKPPENHLLIKRKAEYDELVDLKSKYSNPKALIDLVLNDYIEIDRSKTPILTIEPILSGKSIRKIDK